MKFRVKPGKTFGVDSQYSAGDVIELPAEVGASFPDKLEPVQEAHIKVQIVPQAETVDDVPVIRKSRKKKDSHK